VEAAQGAHALPFAVANASGERLDHAYRAAGTPQGEAPHTLVVIAHGVTSHWDRPWQTGLADALSDAGLPSLLVSYAGNGRSEGRFEDATPSKEADDLGAVIDAVSGWGVQRLVYAGHSMGGAVGVLRASVDPRLAVLVSLAGMFHVHAFMQRHFGTLAFGELMLDKPGCPWNPALAADAARLGSLASQAAAVRVPWLLVHGDADELVPLQDAEDARAAAGGRPRLVVLPGIDHRFTGAIPEMTATVVTWLQSQLGRG
jgi:uncharacterized protein